MAEALLTEAHRCFAHGSILADGLHRRTGNLTDRLQQRLRILEIETEDVLDGPDADLLAIGDDDN